MKTSLTHSFRIQNITPCAPTPPPFFPAQSLRVMLVIELWSKTNWTRNFKLGSRISYSHDSLRDIPKRVCKTKKPKCRIILLIFQPSHDQGKMGTYTFNAKCSYHGNHCTKQYGSSWRVYGFPVMFVLWWQNIWRLRQSYLMRKSNFLKDGH